MQVQLALPAGVHLGARVAPRVVERLWPLQQVPVCASVVRDLHLSPPDQAQAAQDWCLTCTLVCLGLLALHRMLTQQSMRGGADCVTASYFVSTFHIKVPPHTRTVAASEDPARLPESGHTSHNL